MLRRILMASVGAAALAGSAAAADLPSRAPVYAPPAPYNWTGDYLGGQIGYVWANNPANLSFPGATAASFGLASPAVIGPEVFPLGYIPSGVIGGIHGGYNLQIAQWVVGIEGDIDGTSLSRTFTAGGIPPLYFSGTRRQSVQASGRGRVGIAFDRVLLYATGGVAFADFENDYATNVFGQPFWNSFANGRIGWTAGAGVEYVVTGNWSVRAEYRYSDFGHFTTYPFNGVPITAGAIYVTNHPTENRVQVGFSYKFEPSAPPPALVAKY